MKLFSRTAVILFSLDAVTEAKRKPIFGRQSPTLDVELYTRMIEQMEQVCQESGLANYHFNDRLQRGKGFGERFCNMIEDAFDLGYERLIIVGNDSPDMDTATLQITASRLEEGGCTVTPTDKGGIASLALRREDYDRQAFRSIHWCTERVFDEVSEILGSRLVADDVIAEISDMGDLIAFSTSPERYSPLLAFVRAILQPFYYELPKDSEPSAPEFMTSIGRRGPPFKA